MNSTGTKVSHLARAGGVRRVLASEERKGEGKRTGKVIIESIQNQNVGRRRAKDALIFPRKTVLTERSVER
jgi:hypothetical protein